MDPRPRVLIVDDDALFQETYEDILEREGYAITAARTREDALEALDRGDWEIVLLDQKLLGAGGPDEGLHLIEEVHLRSPGAKPIMVTAYGSSESVRRAFEKGAYDFLEKSRLLEPLLLAKARNAVEAIGARRLSGIDVTETETEIREAWKALDEPPDPNVRGRALEILLTRIFKTIPGFRSVDSNLRNALEEFDLTIRNESEDPFWKRESLYLLVECKNWSKPVGVDQLCRFLDKLPRFGRVRLGMFIAPGGVTEPFRTELRSRRREDTLVMVLEREHLEALVFAPDRNEWLKQYHRQATLITNGS